MDHPCFKCSQPVEDGLPFCTHCRAPQIRVIFPEPVTTPAAVAEDSPATERPIFAAARGPIAPGAGRWTDALRPCALAVVVVMVLAALGLNPLVGQFTLGVLAVAFYRYRRPLALIDGKTGAQLGAMGGLIWLLIAIILVTLSILAITRSPEMREAVIQKIQEQGPHSFDPQQLGIITDFVKTPSKILIQYAGPVTISCVLLIVISSLGGALTGMFLRQRDKR